MSKVKYAQICHVLQPYVVGSYGPVNVNPQPGPMGRPRGFLQTQTFTGIIPSPLLLFLCQVLLLIPTLHEDITENYL